MRVRGLSAVLAASTAVADQRAISRVTTSKFLSLALRQSRSAVTVRGTVSASRSTCRPIARRPGRWEAATGRPVILVVRAREFHPAGHPFFHPTEAMDPAVVVTTYRTTEVQKYRNGSGPTVATSR